MAGLSIRKLDDDIYSQLKKRAAIHGLSMEEEVRQIIIKVIMEPENIGAVFQKHFGAKRGIDINFQNDRKPHEPMDFDK